MKPIRVPKPSPMAFHKNRRVSDLLLTQIRHFQHVAQKRSVKIDPEVARDVHTEGGAARYIATVTRALRKDVPSTAVRLVPVDRGRKTRPGKAERIPATGTVPRIAAAAAESKSGRSKARATAQRAATRKPSKAQRTADSAANKKSKSRTTSAKKTKSKAGSKVRAKAKPRKRKKS
jgi:hypothetical protein